MGSERSGRGGIEYSEVQRAARLCRQGYDIQRVAEMVGLERKTVMLISRGEHISQRQQKYHRCKHCGAISRRTCACQGPPDQGERSPQTESRIERLRAVLDPARDPPEAPPPSVLKTKWQLGAVSGAGSSGKTMFLRQWFPGATVSFRWGDGPLAEEIVDAITAWGSLVAALRVVGLSRVDQVERPFYSLSSSEQDAAELARALICGRRTVILDWLPRSEARTQLRVARKVSRELRRGVWGRNKRVIAVSTSDLTSGLTPDWHLSVSRHGRLRVC